MRMMNVLLKITDFPHKECIDENTILLADIKAVLHRVQVTMAKYLHNGGVTISLRLAEQKERVKRLTPREMLRKLVETNSDFADMQKELQLVVD